MQPELVTLYGGPFDGRELWIEPSGAGAMALRWHDQPAVYLRDESGAWKFDTGRPGPSCTGDAIVDRAINIFGRDMLLDMLAVVAVKQTMAGDFAFWSALTARVDRLGESS